MMKTGLDGASMGITASAVWSEGEGMYGLVTIHRPNEGISDDDKSGCPRKQGLGENANPAIWL
jgi:hypothetical protein